MTVPADLSEMVEGARATVPVLRERREQTDELRRLPDDSVEDLRRLGVLGTALPEERGGSDLGADAIVEVAIALGRGCGATAWCGGNWAVHNLMMAMFPVDAQNEVFDGAARRLPIISTGFSPLRGKTEKVDGGRLVSGQWDFVSGVDHADWVIVMAIGEEGPVAHLLPRSDLTVVDTWHTTGLRGTGSKDVTGQSVFVPDHHLLPMAAPSEGRSIGRELYGSTFLRLPLASFFGAAVVGSVLGMAVGALEVFQERTGSNLGGLSGIKISDRPEIHHKMGESAADIAAAQAVIRASYAEMRAAATWEPGYTMEDRLRWRRDAAWCAKIAAGAVGRLYEAGGAHVLFHGDQLEQFQRDVTAGSHHYGLAWDTLFSGYGRVMAGMESQVAMV